MTLSRARRRVLWLIGAVAVLVARLERSVTLTDGLSSGDDVVQSLPESVTCNALNSKAWLEGPRFGNINETDQRSVLDSILDIETILARPGALTRLLRQTLADEESRFLREDDATETAASARRWAVRLAYLAVHYHQHRHSIPEARLRRKSDCSLPVYDYECPDAKFIAVPLSGNGLGVNVRTAMAELMVPALNSNRILVLTNNAPGRPPWDLASCDRHDHQCVFRPLSPCVPTLEDLNNTVHLNKEQSRALYYGQDTTLDHDAKVWHVSQTMRSKTSVPKQTVDRIRNYVDLFLSHVDDSDSRLPILRKAADMLQYREQLPGAISIGSLRLPLFQAITFYSMRPNTASARVLESMMTGMLPHNFTSSRSIGLPIRASDKCNRESECLSYEKHLGAAGVAWDMHGGSSPSTKPHLIVTSESIQIMQEQRDMMASNRSRSFPFEFLINEKDVAPDSGKYRQAKRRRHSFSADDAMLGSLSTLKLQMKSAITVANCCSNFHLLLSDFLMEGLGAAESNSFVCLQDMPPEYVVCCYKESQCVLRREEMLATKT